MRVFLQDGLAPEDPLAGGFALDPSFLFYLVDQVGDPSLVVLVREVFSAGQSGELEGFDRSSFFGIDPLAFTTLAIEISAIHPGAGERLTLEDLVGRVKPWPPGDPFDEPLLDRIADQVFHPADLGLGLF